jgi:hypothetical protein
MPYSTCTLLALLLLFHSAHAITPVILFTHQSQHVIFQNWFDYLTLCFAPLIAHVVGGVANPTVIPPHSKEPSGPPFSHTSTPFPSSGVGMPLLIAVCEPATGTPPTWPPAMQSSGIPRKHAGTAPRTSCCAHGCGSQKLLA